MLKAYGLWPMKTDRIYDILICLAIVGMRKNNLSKHVKKAIHMHLSKGKMHS